MRFLRKLAEKPMLTIAAACFGAFVIVADQVLAGAMLGRPAGFSEPGVHTINGLLVAGPFVWLAYRGSTRLFPWLTGIVLTLWLWWRWLLKGVAYQRAPDGSGVPMDFALLMIISPVLIGVACAWLDEVLRQFQFIRAGRTVNGRPSALTSALIAASMANQKWLGDISSIWRRF